MVFSAYGKHARFEKLESLMRQVKNYKAADTAVYNSAIDAYQRAMNYGDMEKVFEEMKAEGFVPNNITYTIMIEAYKRVRKFDKAEKLRQEWNESKSKQRSYY